jgi:FkbM family methyltransferase
MQCNICRADATPFGRAAILNKYDVSYFQCTQCRFVQTETPYWLDEAYKEPIATSDIGLVARNLWLTKTAKFLISKYFNADATFLDYGGGYGLFVRLMRDTGFDFLWYDKFCRNLLAGGSEGKTDRQYEILTAFELFEHLVDPQAEIAVMLKLSDSILFSTELLPDSNPTPGQWHYYVPHVGQHISFYTHESLQHLAQQLGLNLYSNRKALHLLTRKTLPDDLLLDFTAINTIPDRPSLLQKDAAKVFAIRQNVDDPLPETVAQPEPVKILVDGVFFQLYRTGIARLWQSVLQEWAKDEFSQSIVVLDRNNTCPKIPGIEYLSIPEFSYENVEADRALLQHICDQENADLFISTYYTTPISTPSVFMGYDMIPEVMGWDLAQPMWQSKHHAIAHASAHITISDNTAADLQTYFPTINPEQVNPILCGVAEHFGPASAIEVMQFRSRYNIHKPYFLLVGAGFGYKNVGLFIEGLSQLCSRNGFEVICTGSSAREISAEARKLMPDVIFHPLYLEDDELCAAYSGAVALVYPSKYEGFGLPVVEAMKSGCPVITCQNASLPEVGGDAVIYIDDSDVNGMCEALLKVQNPNVRHQLIADGQQQASKFTWLAMAAQMKSVLLNTAQSEPNHPTQALLVLIDWAESAEKIHDGLLTFFQIICGLEQSKQYKFLINTAGGEIETADEIVSSAFMQTLMMDESVLFEPIVQLTEQNHDNLDPSIVAQFNLAEIQTTSDFLDLISRDRTLVIHNIHGYDLEFPPSHALPWILQNWPYYSSNLGRIAQAVHQKYADLTFIDVGANIGDSVAILRRLAHFPILCIEGDRAFLDVLSRNVKQFDAVAIAPCYVGEDDVSITAKSTGVAGTAHLVSSGDNANGESIKVEKLGGVLSRHREFLQPKMIKIDTDGFDGKILRGAVDVLRSAKPVVFFEYDPFFLAQQNDNGIAIFSLLIEHGYSGLIVYDNFGDLLLCMPKIEIDRMEELNLYFSGRQSKQYCDACAFHQEDQDLYEQTRMSELAFFRNLKP